MVIAKNSTETAGAANNIKKTLDGKCGGRSNLLLRLACLANLPLVTANFTPTDGSIPQDVTVSGNAFSTIISMFTLGFLLAVSFVWFTIGLPAVA